MSNTLFSSPSIILYINLYFGLYTSILLRRSRAKGLAFGYISSNFIGSLYGNYFRYCIVLSSILKGKSSDFGVPIIAIILSI